MPAGRRAPARESWVVYRVNSGGPSAGRGAVCGRAEWDELIAGRPGFYTLVEVGIPNEGRAEELARVATGFIPPPPRGSGPGRRKTANINLQEINRV